MNKHESATLNIARVVMMLAVLFLHSYTSVRMYQDMNSLPIYSNISRVFSWQFGELGVPTFFVIAGYLFFYSYQSTLNSYASKIKRRFHSLFIPYVFWTLLFLIVFYLAEFSPLIRGLFNDGRGLVQDYSWIDFLRAFWAEKRTGNPFLTQLWFVRDLMVMVSLAPLIHFLIKKMGFIFVIVLGLLWYVGVGWYSELGTLFFYCLGAWFGLCNKRMIFTVDSYRLLLVIVFISLSVADALLQYHPINEWLHRASLLIGPLFVLTSISWMVEKKYIYDVRFLSASSFFVFVAHDPMLRFIRKFSLKFLDHHSEIQMILDYFASIALDLAILYGVYWLLSRCAPKFLSIISGGRG